MEVSVLGPVEVSRDGAPVDLGTPKQRALVAALALSRGWPVSVDGIVALLWDDDAPPGVTATLQAYVSQLRRVLEPERERRAPATVLVTVAPGYALRVPDESLDAHRFETTVTEAHRTLQPVGWGRSPLDAGVLTATVAALDEALGLWRGEPFAELGDADNAVAERARLDELRLVALEDRAVGELALGHHATVAAELESLTSAYPLRERLWALRALALTRSGRQADALDVLRQVREVLDEELGLEPSAELRDLQTAVLRQDPDLEWQTPAVGSVPQPAPTPAPTPRPAPAEQVAPWPMVGRDADLESLVDVVDAAERGRPSYAVITGEPGIGKSRLAAELVLRARQRGLRVLVGRCSQDDGAPPLRPWKSVLEALGESLLDREIADEGDGGQFRTWERIADVVRTAAQQQPTVVVLDDLHWADTSTLRVLRLLVETTDSARLLVVATWRDQPEPSGVLAEVAEALARMHALRLRLSGLPPAEAATVFASVTSRDLAPAEAAALRDRTEGNPFFLVELARLAAERGAAGTPVGDELPTAVTDVLNRRLLRLPERTVVALRAAAVIGREFDVPTLAGVTGIDEDDLIDVVEPAQAAGLVREDGIDQYLFAHALVRDTLRASLSASRRARAHARIADVLAEAPGRETEVARHWREAGPSYADRAWRSAVDAAALARRLFAYDQAAELLEGALVSMDGDAQATLRDRYDVLEQLVEAYRWAAQLPDLVATVEQAIEVGKQLRDPVAVAQAAIATARGVLWRSAPPGQVNETVVAALRGSLDRLPVHDSDLRARTMLTLANELQVTTAQERRALCDEGLAMARRIGDPELVRDCCQIWFVALWSPETAPERLALITEAMELSLQIGSERGHLVSSCLRAGVLNELGRPAEMFATVEAARAEAERLRIAFGEVVLDGVVTPWRAMAGRFEECEELLDHTRRLVSRMSHGNADEAVLSSLLAVRLWQGRAAEVVPLLLGFPESPSPFAASIAVCLWRAGEHERARAHYDQHGISLELETDVAMLTWCHAAELALYLGERSLGAAAYERIVPYAGRNGCAGSYLALGPVDAYLAMAAAASGATDLATRHADAAVATAEEWQLPLFAGWLRELRAAYGF